MKDEQENSVSKTLESEEEYLWEISHYCMPHEGAVDAYRPSGIVGSTVAETEHMLLRYMRQFTNIGVVPNDRF